MGNPGHQQDAIGLQVELAKSRLLRAGEKRPPVLSILRSRSTAEDGRSKLPVRRNSLLWRAGCGGWKGNTADLYRRSF